MERLPVSLKGKHGIGYSVRRLSSAAALGIAALCGGEHAATAQEQQQAGAAEQNEKYVPAETQWQQLEYHQQTLKQVSQLIDQLNQKWEVGTGYHQERIVIARALWNILKAYRQFRNPLPGDLRAVLARNKDIDNWICTSFQRNGAMMPAMYPPFQNVNALELWHVLNEETKFSTPEKTRTILEKHELSMQSEHGESIPQAVVIAELLRKAGVSIDVLQTNSVFKAAWFPITAVEQFQLVPSSEETRIYESQGVVIIHRKDSMLLVPIQECREKNIVGGGWKVAYCNIRLPLP